MHCIPSVRPFVRPSVCPMPAPICQERKAPKISRLARFAGVTINSPTSFEDKRSQVNVRIYRKEMRRSI